MLPTLPEFPTIAAFIDTMRSGHGAAAVSATGEFAAHGCRYQLSWGANGPQVRRLDAERHPVSAFFRRRLGEGELSSYSDRMTRALAGDKTARRHCFEFALSSWSATGAGSRTEAVQRILACHDAGGAELDLRGLGLTTLPMALGDLAPHLRVLRLSGNRFDAVPPVIEQLRSLQVLELAHNVIDEVPRWLQKLQALRVLSLRNNRLTRFPSAVFSLARCAFVWIDGNRIADLPMAWHYNFECFAADNPLNNESRSTVAYLFTHATQAPVHHDCMAGGTERMPGPPVFPAPGPGHHGRLVSLLHADPADLGGPVFPTGPFPERAAAQASALMDRIAKRLTAVPEHLKRAPNVLAYRLDLLQCWMATDGDLSARCTEAMGDLEHAGDGDVMAALDRVELAVVDHLLERFDFGIERLAETGRGQYRQRLLEAVVDRGTTDSVGSGGRATLCRMLLAHDLDLPGEVRPIGELEWSDARMWEQDLAPLRESVLCLEASADFDGLESHMADWRPWQQYVRRRQADAAAGVTVPATVLPRPVADALALLPELIAWTSTQTHKPLDEKQSFRLLCRSLYRVYRGGRIAALERQLSHASGVEALAPAAAGLPPPTLDA